MVEATEIYRPDFTYISVEDVLNKEDYTIIEDISDRDSSRVRVDSTICIPLPTLDIDRFDAHGINKRRWKMVLAGSLGTALAQNAYKLIVGGESGDVDSDTPIVPTTISTWEEYYDYLLSRSHDDMPADTVALLNIAKNNTVFKDRIIITPIVNYNFEDLPSKRNDDFSYINELQERAVIISNTDLYYGAAAVLDTDVLSKVSEAFGENLHILPSDIHGCTLIAESEKSESEVQDLQYMSNILATLPAERLSDSVYYFDNKTKQITKPPQSQEKTEQQRTSQTEPKR